MSDNEVRAHVRIAGHRVALVPRAPFTIARTVEGVEVTHGAMLARLRVVDETLRYIVDGGAQGLHDLMVAVDTDYTGPFRLETSDFVCDWPGGFRLASPDRDGPFLFDLLPDAGDTGFGAGCLLFMAGPYTQELCPSVDALVGEGRVETGREEHDTYGAITVSYEHRGAPHSQWHARFVVGDYVFVLTAQGPVPTFDAAHEAARVMAESFRT